MRRNEQRPMQHVCRLCKMTKELRESHLLPASLYKLMRAPELSNPNPVMMTDAVSLPTSRQVESHLLCEECEQRFNQKGEKWVVDHCYRGKEGFPLRDSLRGAAQIWQKGETFVVAVKNVPTIEVGQLVYFGSSVFWRASVHRWNLPHASVHIGLGRYEEEFRQYLVGAADFPADAAMWTIVSSAAEPTLAFNFPKCLSSQPSHRYSFTIPGITFDLFVGKRIESYIRRTCMLRSKGHLMYLTKHGDKRALRDMLKTMETSRASKGLSRQQNEIARQRQSKS